LSRHQQLYVHVLQYVCTCAEADCVLLVALVSDCRAVTVAVGARISWEDRGTARPRLLATCTRLLCWA